MTLRKGSTPITESHPELMSTWDYQKNSSGPENYSKGSHTLLYWLCPLGHSYQASIPNRISGKGCGGCAGKYVISGFNDLLTAYPQVVDHWDYEQNPNGPEFYTSMSSKDAFFLCDQHGSYKKTVKKWATSKWGCSLCKNTNRGLNKTQPPHGKSLSDIKPDVASEWDYGKNDKNPEEHNPGADAQAWFTCSVGHPSYLAWVYHRPRTGCPMCAKNLSRSEQEIFDYISNVCNINCVSRTKDLISPLEIDIYIPSLRIGIEFNGLWWHSELFKDPSNHEHKQRMAREKGVQLLTIWEDDWRDRNSLIKRMINHKLGVSSEERVYARKTRIDPEVPLPEAKSFMADNHIQGYTGSTYRIGLRDYQGNLVALMLFKQNGSLRLERYATSCHVIGGQSKILSYVDQNIDYTQMVTFADLMISDGSLYEKTGWTLDSQLPPDYSYLYKGSRNHKFSFRKDRFKKDPDLKYDPEMTERELAELNSIPRIWDAGKLRYTRKRM